jgi:hypothetical protein
MRERGGELPHGADPESTAQGLLVEAGWLSKITGLLVATVASEVAQLTTLPVVVIKYLGQRREPAARAAAAGRQVPGHGLAEMVRRANDDSLAPT